MELAAAIQQLHDRCAVYTSGHTASRLLDMIGWNAGGDLKNCVLLEPCVGEGAILFEAVKRLLASLRLGRGTLSVEDLIPRIRGFEIHPEVATAARSNLRKILFDEGVDWSDAGLVSDQWIREKDFLLEVPGYATHIAANPPYVRWGKMPSLLATKYRAVLPPVATRGDLSVAFLHRMQQWGQPGTEISVLVSDRWMFAQYGEEFVKETKGRGWVIHVADERPNDPFVRDVGAYSAIVLLSKSITGKATAGRSAQSTAKSLHNALVAKFGTIADAGCTIRVGPALGAGKTFLVKEGEMPDVEAELVRTFVNKQDLLAGEVSIPRLRVIVPYDLEGRLIELKAYPRFAAWAERRREQLSNRSQFRTSKEYWRTIDAVPAQWSSAPKLLIPELCNTPLIAIDRTGSIPAHSIYALWSDEWPIPALKRVLDAGLLELTAVSEAPRLKLGWRRLYKRFLMRTPLPRWNTLRVEDQENLSSPNGNFDEAFDRVFGFKARTTTF